MQSFIKLLVIVILVYILCMRLTQSSPRKLKNFPVIFTKFCLAVFLNILRNVPPAQQLGSIWEYFITSIYPSEIPIRYYYARLHTLL
ncbi:hypothetical protein HanPI659440_Chr05g0186841 [Helianthus annuus]|nr:hypothetical protein HanPI659440_Chr05g0186841 [Helianthus annuus]